MIISLGEEGTGRYAGHLLVAQCFVVSRFTTPSPDGRGGLQFFIVALPGDRFIVFFP